MLSNRILKGGEFLAFTIEHASAAAGALVPDIPMPPESSILFVIRNDRVIPPHGNLMLNPGDHIYILCTREDDSFVRLIFGVEEPE